MWRRALICIGVSFDLFCLINAISGGNAGDKIVRAIIAFGGRIGNGNLDSTDDVWTETNCVYYGINILYVSVVGFSELHSDWIFDQSNHW